jgi:hypothetical protein
MGKINFAQRIARSDAGDGVAGTPSILGIEVEPVPIPEMPDELKALLEEAS